MSNATCLVYAVRLSLFLAADTIFVLASRPPHHADASEIRKDKQQFVDYTISRIPLLAGPLIYGLTFGQIWHDAVWSRGGDSVLTRWELLGALGMIFGGLLRLWCYRVLGRFFTFNLAIRKDHRLVTSGPYALIRHPSYTGILLMSIGLAARYTASPSFLHSLLSAKLLRFGFWSSCLAPTYVLVRRIQQEEGMLAVEFGAEWQRYAETSWRLVPFVW